MICGGSQTNLYYLCRPEKDLETVERILALLADGASGSIYLEVAGMEIEEKAPVLGPLARQVAAQERYLEHALLHHDLAMMESTLWHATAAVAFYLADDRAADQKVALADYKNDVAAFEVSATDCTPGTARSSASRTSQVSQGS